MKRNLACLTVLACVSCATTGQPKPFTAVDYPYQSERSVWGQRSQLTLRLAELKSKASTATPVLLLHPWGFNMKIWADVAARIAVTNPVVLLDLPGHGKSSKISTPYPMARLAAAALDALEAAGYAKAIVIGNSLGGATAIALAERSPKRVLALGLIAAPGGEPIAGPLKTAVSISATSEACENLKGWIWNLGFGVAMRTESPLAHSIKQDLQAVRRGPGWRAWCSATMDILREVVAYAPALEDVDVPARVIRGDEDLTVWESNSRAMAARLPQAEFIALPGCGHLPQLECPDALFEVLRPLLSAPWIAAP